MSEDSPIPLAYEVPHVEARRRGMRTALSILIGVSLLSILGTWAAVIFYDAEVVLGGGPLIALLSLSTIVLAILTRRPIAMLPGVMHIGLCAFLFLLIWLAEWGPAQARMPLIYAGLGYLALGVPASIVAVAGASARRN